MDALLIIFLIFSFLFGIIIGSFLNVVALRYNTGKSINGRSECFSCGKKLSWFELVPFWSFVIQGGKCRGCKSRISWQYPLTELFTGIIFLGLFLKFNYNLVPIIFYAVIFSILIVILIYDMRHRIIPDGLVFTFIGLSFIGIFFHSIFNLSGTGNIIWDIVAGPLLALPFYLIWLLSNGRWMGLGDGKLILGIGWLMGIVLGTSSVIISFWIGAVVSIILLLLPSKKLTIKSEIPFAPFLILGLMIVFFFNLDVLGLGMILQGGI